MTIGNTMWDSNDAALLALTALERWSAARKVHPRSGQDYSVILLVALLLLALIVLLWWVSHRRPHMPPAPARDLFSDGAARRGLGARDRQMLLAIVARSGLQRRHDIFITPEAFDLGAAKLLEECARSWPARDSERLRAEMAALRERLVYRAKGTGEHIHVDSFTVHAPATVARLPFIRATESEGMTMTDWFEAVRGVVTEVSGSGLQVRSPLSVQVDERVLILFALGSAEPGEATDDTKHREHIVGHVGRVTHKQPAGEETVITVDVTDLTSRELDELIHLAQAAALDAPAVQGV